LCLLCVINRVNIFYPDPVRFIDAALIKNQKVPDEIDSTTKTIAYFIKKNGIEGRNFKQKSLDAVMKGFNVDIKSIGADSLVLKFNVK